MKKGLLSSYFSGIRDVVHGERYGTILRYFTPELITAMVLYSVPFWLDAHFISHLKSTPSYATLGATNNLLHLLIKMAEAFSIGTVILVGRFNGMEAFKKVGRTVKDSFWVTLIIGTVVSSFLFLGAYQIYHWYGVPKELIKLGIPFLRLRAIGVFFSFLYLAFVGFLRGIKNPRTPMKIFVFGTLVFIFFDYALIFGKFGFPLMGLQGSALASVIQYSVMFGIIITYIMINKKYRKFSIQLFTAIKDFRYIKELLQLSWPIILDKATMALAYIWLCKMISPLGTMGVATFCVVKDMERIAFLPAIAFAQVITFLASNDVGRNNWTGIKSNIKKIVFMASIMVFSILLFLSLWPENIIQIFDKTGDFTQLAANVFPILSILVFFDLLQLILAGAIRGAGRVKVVMFTRLIICLCYFFPVSYFISMSAIEPLSLKFILIYGSFYIGNALMSIVYINWFRSQEWKAKRK